MCGVDEIVSTRRKKSEAEPTGEEDPEPEDDEDEGGKQNKKNKKYSQKHIDRLAVQIKNGKTVGDEFPRFCKPACVLVVRD